MKRRVLFSLLAVAALAAFAVEPLPASAQGAPAAVWRVDPAASSIRFSFALSDGEGGENPINGRFTRWRSDIRFDPANLAGAEVNALIETASATDGVPLHDATLPSELWFDSAHHPTARFHALSFRRDGARYLARGELAIKGVSQTVEFPFSLQIAGARAVMDGHLSIDRHDFDVGARAAEDDFVGRQVSIDIHVEASRA